MGDPADLHVARHARDQADTECWPWPGRWRTPSTGAELGLVYSVVIAFMFCYRAWNRLVLMLPVAVSSVATLATPVVGVLSGILVLGEPLTWHELAAGAFIVGAIALVLIAPRPDRRPPA